MMSKGQTQNGHFHFFFGSVCPPVHLKRADKTGSSNVDIVQHDIKIDGHKYMKNVANQ